MAFNFSFGGSCADAPASAVAAAVRAVRMRTFTETLHGPGRSSDIELPLQSDGGRRGR